MDSTGTEPIVIKRDGEVISRSKDLRALRRYCKKSRAASVSVLRYGDGSTDQGASLLIVFRDGASCVSKWASFGALLRSLVGWQSLYGVSLRVNGDTAGTVNLDNEYLNPTTYGLPLKGGKAVAEGMPPVKMAVVLTSQLTEECWSIQMFGEMMACRICPWLGNSSCGGVNILKTGKNSKGFSVPLSKREQEVSM